MVQNSIRLLEPSYRDPEFAAFLARAEHDSGLLSPEERLRWDAYMTAVFRHFGNLIYQHRVGALDHLMWDAYEASLKEHLRNRSWVRWYQENAHVFSVALTSKVESARRELEAEGSTAA